jgi:gluconate 2-dehydrogenase gamma chain
VPEFIDRQLAGPWGAGLQFYAAGPFASGTPRQGYQLPHTPAALVREGLARLRPVAGERLGGRRLEEARPEELDALLRSLERGETRLDPIPSAVFFRQLLDLAMEGFFSDPVYGGNRGMAGWKLVGFPGAHATYAQEIERHGMAWRRPPISMADPDALCEPDATGGGRRT